MKEPKSPPVKPKRTWLRSLRPLLWWLLLVLVLFLYRTHERLSEKTSLKFSITMDGKPVDYESVSTLEGQNFTSGQRVKIGKHFLSVSHPKAHAFSTNLFIWYGEHDLGQIALERMRGALEVRAQPRARSITITGPEFSCVLTNSADFTSSVPTDIYAVKAHWANYDEVRQLNVLASGSASARFAPTLGGLSLQSEPPGAYVVSDSGRTMGTTPLTLSELPAGAWRGELRLDGYIPVPVFISVSANQTNSFPTNLVNWQYAQAIETARNSFASGELERTLQALAAALKAQPDDPAALELRLKATIRQHLRNAEALMAGGSYDKARQEAKAVLETSPDNSKAADLLKEISDQEETKRQKEKEVAELLRQKRIATAKEAFEFVLSRHVEAPLFEAHELRIPLSLDETQTALHGEFATMPAFKMIRENVPTTDSFAIFAAIEIPGGLRRCILVGTQIGNKETQIDFKVMEYKLKTTLGFQGQLTINRGYVPIDPSRLAELSEKERNQLKQGPVLVEQRIWHAAGSQPAANPQNERPE